MARHRIALVLALLAANSLLCSGQAIARPPTEATSQTSVLSVVEPTTPLIGRVRVRGEVLDLTRDSVAEGGSAHDVAQGTARVIADAEVLKAREHNHDPLGKR